MTTHYWWPHIGGIERVALRQAEGLRSRGHRVHVLTSRIGQAHAPVSRDDGSGPSSVTMVRAWDGPARFSVPWPVFAPGLFRHAARLVERCDLILAHGSVFLPTLATMWHARRQGKNVVVVQHNPEISYDRAALNHAQAIAANSLGRWALAGAAKVLVPSTATGAYVRSLVERDVEVLPWGIDLDVLTPQPSELVRGRERAHLGVPAGAFLVVAAGRISAKNRFEILLRAAATAARRTPGLRCVVLGQGPDIDTLQALSAALGGRPTLEVRGHVPDAELRMYLRSADVVVATAGGNEGFGLVVAEALACGVPVVAADQGGHVDLVREGVNGWLFDGTVPCLATALERAMACLSAEPRASRAHRVRATVEALTWDRHLLRLEAVLRDACSTEPAELVLGSAGRRRARRRS